MKRAIKAPIAFLLLIFLWGCPPEPPVQPITGPPVCNTHDQGMHENLGPNIVLSKTEIVLSFDEDINMKDELVRKQMHDSVLIYMNLQGYDLDKIDKKTCECGDFNQQIWTFDTDTLEIETRVTGLQGGGQGPSGVEGDQQFTILLPQEGDGIAVDTTSFEQIRHFVGDGMGQINIAVMDTGIDLKRLDNADVLFQNPNGMGANCGEGMSGWNFVENNTDIQDDHEKVGHGTLVTKTIISAMDQAIDYRILPLKVFDKNGKGKYGDIICALSYLKKVQQRSGGAIKILNASFGGSLGNAQEDRVDIFRSSIEDLRETAVIVTSAGNCHFNTDLNNYRHYPSGLSPEVILAVGGFDKVNQNYVLNDTSNYGPVNIDVAADFSHSLILDQLYDGDIHEIQLSGTSYSAAYVSGRLATMLGSTANPVGNAKDWKDNFLSTSASTNSSSLHSFIAAGRYVD